MDAEDLTNWIRVINRIAVEQRAAPQIWTQMIKTKK